MFLTKFAQSLLQLPTDPAEAPSQAEGVSVPNEEELPQPAFPIFTTTLRPSGRHSSMPPAKTIRYKSPPQLKHRNVLAPKPAGVLKNKPKSTYFTSETTTKLKEPSVGVKITVPAHVSRNILVSKPAVPTGASMSPHKPKPHQHTPSPPQLSSTSAEHPLSLAFKGTAEPHFYSPNTRLPA